MINELWERDGGPAFPQNWTEHDGAHFIVHGISLRDYFAAQALTAFSHTTTLSAIQTQASAQQIEASDLLAQSAYEVADAMLKARVAKP